MPDVVIPANRQQPGALLGGFWVVLQAWPLANLYTLALLGEGGARITGGYAKYDLLPRTKRVAMTSYNGRTNYELTMDLIYDGWITHPLRPQLPASFRGAPKLPVGVSWSRPGTPTAGGGVWIESQIKTLENLAWPRPDTGVPPSVRIYGPVPHTEVRWLITDIEWGEDIQDKNTGRKMRQFVTVKLVEYSPAELLDKLPRANATPKK